MFHSLNLFIPESGSLKRVDDGDRTVNSLAISERTAPESASTHGRRIRWLLSSASLGNIDDESELVETRLESSASGATLEVMIFSWHNMLQTLNQRSSSNHRQPFSYHTKMADFKYSCVLSIFS